MTTYEGDEVNPYRADAQGDPDLQAMTRALAAEALEILLLLDAVSEAEWRRSQAPVLPEEDTAERGKGKVSDPTGDTVIDGRRLALRAAVIAAEREVLSATQSLSASRRHLLEAAERWQGWA